MLESSQDGVIGVMDSGVGGLSIVRELLAQLPDESITYLADQAHVPYGSRTLEEVREYSYEITRFLLERRAKIIVVACNTASAAALTDLREKFPQVLFVGMEPAVKPAVRATRSGVVGVLATPATFQGKLFASVVERFASDVLILEQTVPLLVEQIEAGDLSSPQARETLRNALQPLLDRGADTIVLACTHYAFVIPQIEGLTPDGVEVIDPSPAIARQAARLLQQYDLNAAKSEAHLEMYTTGDINRMAASARLLIDLDADWKQATWRDGQLNVET